MAESTDNIRLLYDYITAHRNFWLDQVAPEMAVIMRLSREMKLQCRSTLFYKDFQRAHDAMTKLVRERADEGHQTHLDIARTLEEIKAHHESDEAHYTYLMKTGGLRP